MQSEIPGFAPRQAADRLPKDVWELDARTQPDAAEQYRQGCAHLFDITITGPPETFYNRLEGYRLEGAVFGRCQGVAQRFVRTRTHILGDSSDSVQVIVALEGEWAGDYGGRLADSTMGTIRIVDMSRPFDVESGDFRTLNLMIPRAALDAKCVADFHGLVLSEAQGAGQLLGAYLRALWDGMAGQTLDSASAAANAAVALVEGIIASHAADAPTDRRPAQKRLLAAACAYVDKHLGDPELSPERIHEHLGISRSLLYQLFEAEGGVVSFLQTRRLDRAFDGIVADSEGQRTLAEIGYGNGFRSDAHFSRAFRQRFGIAPGGLRQRGRDVRAADFSMTERPGDVWAWLRGL